MTITVILAVEVCLKVIITNSFVEEISYVIIILIITNITSNIYPFIITDITSNIHPFNTIIGPWAITPLDVLKEIHLFLTDEFVKLLFINIFPL